jgi:hypothetical protein
MPERTNQALWVDYFTDHIEEFSQTYKESAVVEDKQISFTYTSHFKLVKIYPSSSRNFHRFLFECCSFIEVACYEGEVILPELAIGPLLDHVYESILRKYIPSFKRHPACQAIRRAMSRKVLCVDFTSVCKEMVMEDRGDGWVIDTLLPVEFETAAVVKSPAEMGL